MDLFHKVKGAISEREMSLLLRIYPPEMYKPFDPVRKKDHRFLKLDLVPYTSLYIFRDLEEQIKVFSSSDMGLITKDTLLVYISSEASLEGLNNALERESYPYINLPEEGYDFQGTELVDEILAIEATEEDPYNILSSVHGDTLPLYEGQETVNFAFVSQPSNSFHFFNQNPGIHHTIGLKTSEKIIVQFNPLLCFQNVPEDAGYITFPFVDKKFSRYLKGILDKLEKQILYNLHSADDYYKFLKYLFYSHDQTNEKISIIQLEKIRGQVEFLIGFKTEVSSMKKREVGALINTTFLEAFNFDDKAKDYQEKKLNLSGKIIENWMALRTELDGEILRVNGVHSIAFYKSMIVRFFGEQPIKRVGVPV